MKFCKAILLLVCLINKAHGLNYTWTGAQSTDFNDPLNWSLLNGSIPGASDIAIYSGTYNLPCSLPFNTTIGGIQIPNTYNESIQLNGFNLNIVGSGASIFQGGTINNTGPLTTINFSGASNITFGSNGGTTFSTNINITGTLTGTAVVIYGAGAVVNGNLSMNVPRFFLNGIRINGSADLTQNSPVTTIGPINSLDPSSGNNYFGGPTTITNLGLTGIVLGGGNTFNSSLTLTNSGTSYIDSQIVFGYTGPADIYNGVVTIISNASNVTNDAMSQIYLSSNNSSTFNENIQVTCTNQCYGVFFGDSGGTSTLASGKTITTPLFDAAYVYGGTNGGILELNRFTQTGTASQTLSLNGEAILRLLNSSFGGSVNASSASLIITSSTFSNSANFSKIDPYGFIDTWSNNTFTNDVRIVHSSIGNLTGSNNIFNGDLHLTKNNFSGLLRPCSTGCSLTGDLTVDGTSTTNYTIAQVSFVGTGNQTITRGGSIGSLVMNNLTINQATTTSTVTLQAPILLTTNSLSLQRGVIKSDRSNVNIITFSNGVTASPTASLNSFIDGPALKQGTSAFTFPIGFLDNTQPYYKPISMSAPSANSSFRACYYKQPFSNTSSRDASLATLSGCEYWLLDRTAGTGNVSITLGWLTSDCPTDEYITNTSFLRVARWNGTTWKDLLSPVGITGSASSGTITTGSLINTYGPFTLASTSLVNPLPIELENFDGRYKNGTIELSWKTLSEINNEYFRVEKSKDGIQFNSIGSVQGGGTTSTANNYQFIDKSPWNGTNYYRLTQYDFDKKYKSFDIIKVNVDDIDTSPLASPNPIRAGERLFLKNEGNYILVDTYGCFYTSIKNSTEFVLPDIMQPGLYFLIDVNKQHRFKLVVF